MSIENAFVGLIAGLATAAGARVYQEFSEPNPALPVVIVTRTGGSVASALGGAPLFQRATLSVEVLAESLPAAESVIAAVQSGLHGYKGTAAGVEILRVLAGARSQRSVVEGDYVVRVVGQDFQAVFR